MANPTATWSALARPSTEPVPTFDPAELDELPAPAARWLRRVLPMGAQLISAVVVTMEGRIRLGSRWLPFTAEQIVRTGAGFVWRAQAGPRMLRVVGADSLGPAGASVDFRLHGLVPLARASGPNVFRSAAGRLAVETVAWLPTSLTPSSGVVWTAGDDTRATVAVPVPDGTIDVTVTVEDDGRLRSVSLERWDGEADPPRERPFGGEIGQEWIGPGGVRIAGSATVGWDHGTAQWSDGVFFEFTVLGAHVP